MSFIDSRTLQFYVQSHATKVRSKPMRTKPKTDAAPDHMPGSRQPNIAEKHRTSGARTPRPQNHNPHSKPQGRMILTGHFFAVGSLGKRSNKLQ